MADLCNCDFGTLTFTYLGVPIMANMKLCENWNPIVEQLKAKLSTLKSKILSFGHGMTLVISVLGSIRRNVLESIRPNVSVGGRWVKKEDKLGCMGKKKTLVQNPWSWYYRLIKEFESHPSS